VKRLLVVPLLFAVAHKLYYLYDVRWQDMDLSDPRHPKLRIAKGELRHAR